MKSESYDKMRELVSKIDRLKDGADGISETLASVKENGGNGKMYIRTNGQTCELEISGKPIETMLSEVLKTYYDLIRESQKELNTIINGMVGADTTV